MQPPDGDAQRRVLTALVIVHHRDGRATVRAVAAQADRTTGRVHLLLERLRAAGLAHWSAAADGSLRPAHGLVVAGGELYVATPLP